MDIADIINAIQSNRVNITQHARQEAQEDHLHLDEIFYSTQNGEVIEDYPADAPYPSCLIYGQNQHASPVHSVWAYTIDSRIAILVTVYRPDPNRWVDWKIRK